MTEQTVLGRPLKSLSNEEVDLLLLEAAGEAAVRSMHKLVTDRFKELQQAEGLTQEVLAQRMGVPASQISRWLKRPKNMTFRSAAGLLNAMGRRLDIKVT